MATFLDQHDAVHENHPARRMLSRSLSASTNVTFITGRVIGSRLTSIIADETLDPEPGVLPAGIGHARHRSCPTVRRQCRS